MNIDPLDHSILGEQPPRKPDWFAIVCGVVIVIAIVGLLVFA